MRINQGLWLYIARFGSFSLIVKQFLLYVHCTFLDVNGQLTQKIFYELHGIKELSQALHIPNSTFFSLSLFFGSDFKQRRMYTFCWTRRMFWTRQTAKTRGPRILFELVSTHFFARCVEFHFSSSVYIPSRLRLRSLSWNELSDWAELSLSTQ